MRHSCLVLLVTGQIGWSRTNISRLWINKIAIEQPIIKRDLSAFSLIYFRMHFNNFNIDESKASRISDQWGFSTLKIVIKLAAFWHNSGKWLFFKVRSLNTLWLMFPTWKKITSMPQWNFAELRDFCADWFDAENGVVNYFPKVNNNWDFKGSLNQTAIIPLTSS